MKISEIFLSIQGESSYAGTPCIFVRLSGCNLNCGWCDTMYANTDEKSRELTVEAVIAEVKGYKCQTVEITGGEPLLQAASLTLAKSLLELGYTVMVETNGSVSLEGLDERVIKVVDVKCPSSGQAGSFLVDNLEYITPSDELKFVIGGRADYDFAKNFLVEYVKGKTDKILFAPVKPGMEPKDLAEWILGDSLNVRLQLQIHSYIWNGTRGR